jgi:hypothetical protein
MQKESLPMKKPFSIIPFIIAPLVPAVGMALYAMLSGAETRLEYVLEDTVMVYIFTSFLTICIGMPTYKILRYIHKITWYTTLIGGFVDGVIAGKLIHLLFSIRFDDPDKCFYQLLFYELYGTVTGFVFWLASKQFNSFMVD